MSNTILFLTSPSTGWPGWFPISAESTGALHDALSDPREIVGMVTAIKSTAPIRFGDLSSPVYPVQEIDGETLLPGVEANYPQMKIEPA